MKRILILGASRYYLRSIQAARRLGYTVLAVDVNPDAPGLAAADHAAAIDLAAADAVLGYARQQGVDGIAALNDYGVATAATVCQALGLPGLSPQAARIATDKELMRRRWDEAGLPNPRWRLARNVAECFLAVGEIGLPVVLKPAVSMGGARGVSVVADEGEVANAWAFATSFYDDQRVLVEECLNGSEHSAELLVSGGRARLLALSDKIKTPPPARVDANVLYPSALDVNALREVERVFCAAVEALEIEAGCCHVEGCVLPNGTVKLFELGARPGGGGTPEPIVPWVTGVNELEAYLRICVGDDPGNLAPSRARGCNYHFVLPRPGRVTAVRGWEAVRRDPRVLDAEVFVRPGDMVRPVRVGADRAGFIIVGDTSREAALQAGRELEALLGVETE